MAVGRTVSTNGCYMNTKQEEQLYSAVSQGLDKETPVFLAPKTDSHATLEDILDHATSRMQSSTSIHHLPQPKALREVFEAIDKTDVEHQTQDYCRLIVLEGQTAVDQLRHRADMMRRRADEFDMMADSYQKAIDDIVRQTGSVNDTHQAILNLLSEHAHIKPVRT